MEQQNGDANEKTTTELVKGVPEPSWGAKSRSKGSDDSVPISRTNKIDIK